jgi:hypothetical protein
MAVPLWFRILSAFNEFRFIATTIIVVQRLLKDSLMFLLLLIPLCIGFSQALLGLDPKREALDGAGFFGVFFWLMRGFIGDLDFESAGEFDSFYGPVFYGIFVMLGYIILLNLLIAIYCESFASILEASQYQFRSQRAVATLQLSDRYDRWPFLVPLNLVEIVIVLPVRLVGSLVGKSCAGFVDGWTSGVWWILCLPVHLLVAIVEEARYVWYRVVTRSARMSASRDYVEGDEDDGVDEERVDGGFAGFVATLVESKVGSRLNMGSTVFVLTRSFGFGRRSTKHKRTTWLRFTKQPWHLREACRRSRQNQTFC